MKGLRKFSQKFSQRSKGHLQNLTIVWERWSNRKQNQRLTDEGGRVCKVSLFMGDLIMLVENSYEIH